MRTRKTSIQKMPRRTRNRKSRLDGTATWRAMQSRLDTGIPPGTAVVFDFSHADLQRLGLETEPMRDRKVATGMKAIARAVKKYVAARNLPYVVSVVHVEGPGLDCVAVKHPRSDGG